jgi:CDP-4-dehydro-6-deoxyglucose reductase
MAHRIRLRPSGHEFGLEGRESVLDAALRGGIHLDHGCATGNCGQCLARLLSGTISQIDHSDYRLSAAEKARGSFLACVNTATSDLVVEAPEAASAADVPLQRLRTTIKRVKQLNSQFSLLQLQTPRTRLLRFLAGQRVRLTLDGGPSGEFHIASCPCDGRNLDIFVRRGIDDDATMAAFSRAPSGTSLALEGPFGDFLLDEESRRARVFVALGAGMGPVLSLIEQLIAVGGTERVDLYLGDRCEKGSHLDNLVRSWQDVLDNFRYHTLAGTTSCRAIAERLDSDGRMSGAEVYLAGPAPEIGIIADAIATRPHRLQKECTG